MRFWSTNKNVHFTLSTIMNLEKEALDILMLLCGNSGCVISDSGGKDSTVIKHLALKAKEKYNLDFKIRHNHTTVDAPETVYYIREEKTRFSQAGIDYEILYPRESMMQLIIRHKTPPTRRMRYCCLELKENTGFGEKLVTGVRKAESKNRKENQGVVTFAKPKKELLDKAQDNENFAKNQKGGIIVLNFDDSDTRRIVENCYRNHKTLINPIINWSDDYLWWYLRKEDLLDSLNPIYKKGMCSSNCRVGCIGCPMAGKQRWEEFAQYPEYRKYYLTAFDLMLKAREKSGLRNGEKWRDAQHVFKWWMEDKNCDGQLRMDEFGNIFEEYSNTQLN